MDTAASNPSLSATPPHGGSVSVSEIEEDVDVFKRLDVVSDHSDHTFFIPHEKDKQFNPSKALQKTISKEWRKLEENLPDSIFVRVYEQRIDLMRAVIVGAAGTPYHDGLYVFDIKFPSDYPQTPPAVRYRSFGVRINPNLYNSGYVCLSLLNTWAGRKRSERWDPNNSNMLQVLVSIQGLVLNEQPYYNEPWLIPSRSHRKKSKQYSEGVFVLSCKSMAWLMNRPPKGLEALVTAHFRGKAAMVLAACAAYAAGRVQVGYYREGCAAAEPGTYIVPTSFKASMVELYPILLGWFLKVGAQVGHLPRQLSVEAAAVKKKKPITEKKNKKKMMAEKKKGSLSMIFGVLKKIVGFGDNKINTQKKKEIKNVSSQVTPSNSK